MKKNRMMRVAVMLLALTLMTSCFVGGTFAKYTSSYVGSDTARVAKWAFEINDVAMASNAFTFDLFKTVNDENGVDAENNVKKGTGENIIAPGTGGRFDIVLENASEVDAQYAVVFNVTSNGIPLQFSLNGTDWTSTIPTITATDIAMDGTATVTVYWKWAFEGGNDAYDTSLGLDGTIKATVEAIVTVTQVN